MSSPVNSNYPLGVYQEKSLCVGANRFPLKTIKEFWIFPKTNEIQITYSSAKGDDYQVSVKLQLQSIEKTQFCSYVLITNTDAIAHPPMLTSIHPQPGILAYEFEQEEGAVAFAQWYIPYLYPTASFEVRAEGRFCVVKTKLPLPPVPQITIPEDLKAEQDAFKVGQDQLAQLFKQTHFYVHDRFFGKEANRVPKDPPMEYGSEKVGFFVATPTSLKYVPATEMKDAESLTDAQEFAEWTSEKEKN